MHKQTKNHTQLSPSQGKNILAFTLVELIVVITILAILWTIAFISLQWYSTSARDSSRLSDLSVMKTSLELFQLDAGKYPEPTGFVPVTYSGWLVWKQWSFWESVFANTDIMDKIPTDPLTDKVYTYSITNNWFKYELWWIIENPIALNLSPLESTFAWDTETFAIVTWNYNWKTAKSLSWNTCNMLAVPSIIANDIETSADLEDIINSNRLVFNGYKNLPATFKTSKFKYDWGFEFNPNIILAYTDTWSCTDLLDKTDSTARVKLVKWLQDAYTWTILNEEPWIKKILDTTIDELNPNVEVLSIALDLVNNDFWWKITPLVKWNEPSNESMPQVYNCITQPSYTNASFTEWTPTQVDQVWQNTNNGQACYYECTWGYSWAQCDIDPPLITESQCSDTGWIWVNNTEDMNIWSTKWNWFCISPRFWDWSDLDNWTWAISWNGWWANTSNFAKWWANASVRDTWANSYYGYGQTKTLDWADWSSVLSVYWCKAIWTASSDYDTSDTIIWRMKWLATTWNDYIEAQSIDWITGITPINWHVIPALYIADCIDWVKDLTTTMTYTHIDNNTENITYADYNTNVTVSTEAAKKTNVTFQNRQKYLTAWTQKVWSHLPSAFSYIVSWNTSAEKANWENLIWIDRWEYQVACDVGKFWAVTWNVVENQYKWANDHTDSEYIWLAAIWYADGTNWWSWWRSLGALWCWNQNSAWSWRRDWDLSARFVVRP